MKTFIVIAVAAVTSFAQARIGETQAECVARYGEPITGEKTPEQLNRSKELTFFKEGLMVMAFFHEGVCEQIVFSYHEGDRLGRPKEISDNELEVLLKANSGGKAWTERSTFLIDRIWEREDQSAFAQYSPTDRLLIILTASARERSAAESKAATEKKLDGF